MNINYDKYIKKVTIDNYATDKVCMALICEGEDITDELVPTVNLGSEIGNNTIMPMYCAFLDTNNCPNIDIYLEEKGIAEPYMRFGNIVMAQSGYCVYPLYKFNKEKLAELGCENFEKYEETYMEAFKEEQDRMNIEMFGESYMDDMDEPEV